MKGLDKFQDDHWNHHIMVEDCSGWGPNYETMAKFLEQYQPENTIAKQIILDKINELKS